MSSSIEGFLRMCRDLGVSPVGDVDDFTGDRWSTAATYVLVATSATIDYTVPNDEEWEIEFASLQVTSAATSDHTIAIIRAVKRGDVLPTTPTGIAYDTSNTAVKKASGVATGVATVFEPAKRTILGPGDKLRFNPTGATIGDTAQPRLMVRSRRVFA